MSQKKKTTITQGAVSEIMSHLSDLPEREKDPATPVGLSELFRTKEYATEIRTALAKGYTFEDLARIFTEKCGVKITARQLKYHHTHEKNLSAKGKKPKHGGTSKKTVSPVDLQPKLSEHSEESDTNVAVVSAISPSRSISSSAAFGSSDPEPTASASGALLTDERYRGS